MNRRNFFREMGQGAARALGRSSKPQPAPKRSPYRQVPSAGRPRDYQAGDLVFVEDAMAWLAVDLTGFYAIDARCTHLGCLVEFDASGGEFICPCHGSRFGRTGALQGGPARSGLRYLRVHLDEASDTLRIDRSRVVEASERLVA